MRTTMDLDEALIRQLVKVSGAKSKTEAIEKAAQEYIALQSRRKLVASFGTWNIQPLPMAGKRRELSRMNRAHKALGKKRGR